MITDSRKLLEITAPQTLEVQEVTWTPAFAKFRPINRDFHCWLAAFRSIQLLGRNVGKLMLTTPYMVFQVISPKLPTNSDIHTQCPHLTRNWLFHQWIISCLLAEAGQPGCHPLKRLPNASLRGLDIEFHGGLHSIPP